MENNLTVKLHCDTCRVHPVIHHLAIFCTLYCFSESVGATTQLHHGKPNQPIRMWLWKRHRPPRSINCGAALNKGLLALSFGSGALLWVAECSLITWQLSTGLVYARSFPCWQSQHQYLMQNYRRVRWGKHVFPTCHEAGQGYRKGQFTIAQGSAGTHH